MPGTDGVLSPVYLLLSYAWAVLKTNTDMDESDYGGLIPIVPIAEIEELSPYDKPHLVYGYSLDSTGDLYARRTGSMSFAVYSTRFREITEILDILGEAFGRLDDSARDVNNFTTRHPQFLGIRFGYIEVGYVEGGTPEDTEGGRMSGLLNIRFDYFVDYNIITNV